MVNINKKKISLHFQFYIGQTYIMMLQNGIPNQENVINSTIIDLQKKWLNYLGFQLSIYLANPFLEYRLYYILL